MQIHLAEKLRGAFSHAYFLPEIDGFLEMRIRLNTVYTPNQIDYKRKRSHPLSFRQKMRRWWLEEEKKMPRLHTARWLVWAANTTNTTNNIDK